MQQFGIKLHVLYFQATLSYMEVDAIVAFNNHNFSNPGSVRYIQICWIKYQMDCLDTKVIV